MQLPSWAPGLGNASQAHTHSVSSSPFPPSGRVHYYRLGITHPLLSFSLVLRAYAPYAHTHTFPWCIFLLCVTKGTQAPSHWYTTFFCIVTSASLIVTLCHRLSQHIIILPSPFPLIIHSDIYLTMWACSLPLYFLTCTFSHVLTLSFTSPPHFQLSRFSPLFK